MLVGFVSVVYMGDANRVDSYSYHSEAGRADGVPGGEERDVERPENKCEECHKWKEDVVERAGSFANQSLCSSCIQTLQEEKIEQERAEVLSYTDES